MNLKSLFFLILAVAIGGLLYYLNANPKGGLVGSNSYLIPGLSEKLNDVTKLTIYEAEKKLLAEISKTEKKWVVENRDGYEADFAIVRSVFNNLADAKLIETKTSNPDNYNRLGVEDIENPQAQGVQFSIEGLGESIDIIAGKVGSVGKSSQYIRRVGEEQSWLIDKKLNINKDVTAWLKKDILDIPPERIKSIQIQHADGTVITIENTGAEEYEFKLLNPLPEGEIISDSEIYQVANALSSLQLTDVASQESINQESVQPVITTFLTFDGLTLTAHTYTIEGQAYSEFSVEFNAENVSENVVKEADSSDLAIISDPDAAREFAQEIAPKLERWAFVLPTITQEALVKKLKNFILAEDAA